MSSQISQISGVDSEVSCSNEGRYGVAGSFGCDTHCVPLEVWRRCVIAQLCIREHGAVAFNSTRIDLHNVNPASNAPPVSWRRETH